MFSFKCLDVFSQTPRRFQLNALIFFILWKTLLKRRLGLEIKYLVIFRAFHLHLSSFIRWLWKKNAFRSAVFWSFSFSLVHPWIVFLQPFFLFSGWFFFCSEISSGNLRCLDLCFSGVRPEFRGSVPCIFSHLSRFCPLVFPFSRAVSPFSRIFWGDWPHFRACYIYNKGV